LSQCVVLVADDGSNEIELEKNKRICAYYGVELLFGHGRTGIAATWNRLTRHYPDSKVVVLINDDIEVVPNWLDVLLYSVEQNEYLAMVSLSSKTGVPREVARHESMLDYNESKLLSGNYALISSQGPIFAFRHELYNLIGGFDERYFCFYEEVDFGVSLGYRGYFSYVASYPNPYHEGGATNSDINNLDAAQHMATSRQKFHDKWGKTLSEIRTDFSQRKPPLQIKEWNSQIKNWTD